MNTIAVHPLLDRLKQPVQFGSDYAIEPDFVTHVAPCRLATNPALRRPRYHWQERTQFSGHPRLDIPTQSCPPLTLSGSIVPGVPLGLAPLAGTDVLVNETTGGVCLLKPFDAGSIIG